MSERNVTRAQAGALNLIENVAHGRNVSQVDRDFLWMAHGDLLAELERLNAEVAALASALDAAHSPHGVPGRGSATCCDGSVCALLERARRWGQ